MGALTTPRLLSLSVALAALAAPGCDVPTTPETPSPVTPAPPVAPPAQPPPPPAPTGTFQALPPEIARGGCSNLSWVTTNATAVTIDQGVGPVSAGGSVVVCPTAATTYVLTASGAGGTLDPPLTVTIVVTEPSPTPTPTPPSGGEETSDPEAHGPSGSLVAIPETIRRGESSVLAWAITSADRASIRPAVGLVEVVSSRAVSPAVTTTYTLSASGPGGDLSPEPHVTVTVLVPPSGSITANPREIAEGECATLSWSTGDATTQFVHPEVGDVPGSGSRTVCPTRTTTYRLNAAGRGGVLDPPRAVTILVRPSQTPAGSLVAFPDPIASGQCSTLTWTTSRSTSQSIDQGIGPVAASGSRSVCPAADTTYTLSASGPGGRLSPSPAVAITVGDPPPSGSLEADPPSIDAGGCSSLIWSITDATGIALDQGIGSVAASGSRSVCPAVTTAYTLTASGRGGTLSPPLAGDSFGRRGYGAHRESGGRALDHPSGRMLPVALEHHRRRKPFHRPGDRRGGRQRGALRLSGRHHDLHPVGFRAGRKPEPRADRHDSGRGPDAYGRHQRRSAGDRLGAMFDAALEHERRYQRVPGPGDRQRGCHRIPPRSVRQPPPPTHLPPRVPAGRSAHLPP